MNTWYQRVINLISRKDALHGVKLDEVDSFYNCVAVLMSNQVKIFPLRDKQCEIEVVLVSRTLYDMGPV